MLNDQLFNSTESRSDGDYYRGQHSQEVNQSVTIERRNSKRLWNTT